MQITLKDVEHRYQANTPFERLALYDLNFTVKSGSYTAIIGHTGSGKSTILQHLNGLLKPTKGSVTIGEKVIVANRKEKDLKAVRKQVGIVFQFPEHQLFEETVEKDICFGPVNFGVPLEQAKQRARELIQLVGLSEEYLERSPFDLSGGQMRRVAIAGVLAMEPDVLVLDEPTAGLDPRGREEIMDLFAMLAKEKKMTMVLVTHSMEDAARYADHIYVMHKGTVKLQGPTREIFKNARELQELGLDIPESVKLQKQVEQAYGVAFEEPWLSLPEAVKGIKTIVEGRGRHL